MPETQRDRVGTPSVPADDVQASGSTTAGVDARFIHVWQAFLGELATDAHKAHAAAIAYRDLDPKARDTWLTVLEHDVAHLEAPRIAVYAPLLAVETDPARRKRIVDAIGELDASAVPRIAARALVGRGRGGERVGVLVMPLYLSFVQVLACGFQCTSGFEWVRHDPILAEPEAPKVGDVIADAELEGVPLNSLIDELALAVLAHTRKGRAAPEALRIFADLFGPAGLVTTSD
jgi:hypothetical protein